MILEALHYMEEKHVPHVLFFQILKRLHAKAGGNNAVHLVTSNSPPPRRLGADGRAAAAGVPVGGGKSGQRDRGGAEDGRACAEAGQRVCR